MPILSAGTDIPGRVVLMAGTFTARIDELRHTLGDGKRLVGSVTVNQVYARYQHEHLELHHPRGGGPKYLQKPLMDGFRDYLTDYAKTVLHDGGQPAMKRSMEHLSDQVEIAAPREWGDLRKSGAPQVTLGERTVYDRAPKAARLGAEELKARSRAILRQRLAEGLTVYFMRGGKVIRIPGKNEPHALRGAE
jgi:hypothetical protein